MNAHAGSLGDAASKLDATEVGTRRAEPPTTFRTTHSCTVHRRRRETTDLYTEIETCRYGPSRYGPSSDMEKRCNMLQDTRNDPASG